MQVGIWICLVIAAGGGLAALAMFLGGGARLQVPDLERWTDGEPAWHSPPVLARFRRGRAAATGIAAGERGPAQGAEVGRAGGDRAA
jgi:hypothetical protein